MGKRKLIEKECPMCHKVFSGRKSQTFCSRNCSRNCSGTFSGPKSAGISKKGKSPIENLVNRFQSIPKPSPNEWKGVPDSLAYNAYIFADRNPNKATLEDFITKYDKYIE